MTEVDYAWVDLPFKIQFAGPGARDLAGAGVAGDYTVFVHATAGESKTMASERVIQEIEKNTEERPTRGGHEPTKADSSICSPEHCHPRDELSIMSYTMDCAHRIGESYPIIGSIERSARDVSHLQSASTSIKAPEQFGFTTTEWTGTVYQNLKVLIPHNITHFGIENK